MSQALGYHIPYNNRYRISHIENYLRFQKEETFLIGNDKKTIGYGTISEHKVVQNLKQFCTTLMEKEDGITKIEDLYKLMKELKMNCKVVEEFIR
jgi:hypothetical protein